MKKLYVLYVLEIIAFISPVFLFKTDIESYIALGFIFTLPLVILTLVFLYKAKTENNKSLKILHWLILGGGVFSGFLALVISSVAGSIGL